MKQDVRLSAVLWKRRRTERAALPGGRLMVCVFIILNSEITCEWHALIVSHGKCLPE